MKLNFFFPEKWQKGIGFLEMNVEGEGWWNREIV